MNKLSIPILYLSFIMAPAIAGAERYSFPARASDLANGQFWWSSGAHAGRNQAPKDVTSVVFDTDQNKFVNVNGSTNVHKNHLVYEMPLYAPVDGEIVTCWRNSPESAQPAGNHSGFPAQITEGGNHVNILTRDGAIVFVGHMKPGTMPESLCPNVDALLPVMFPRTGAYPTAYVLDPATRPKVRRGQFIGRAGDSGNSSGPHVHYHIKDSEGNFQTTFGESVAWEYPLSYAWVQTIDDNVMLDPNRWWPASASIHHADPKLLIWPDPLLRRHHVDSEGGAKHDSASHRNYVVNAFSNTDGDLRIESFRVESGGDISLVGTETGGDAALVKITRVGFSSEFVIGTRDSSGSLKLITVDMENDGAIKREGSVTGDVVTNLAMTSLAPAGISNGIVTASRNSNGLLQLDSWVVSGDPKNEPLSIEHRDTLIGGPVSTLAVTALNNGREPGESGSFRGVVAAVRDADQALKVTAYSLTNSLNFTERGENIGGGVGNIEVSTVRLSSNRKAVVAAVQTNSGSLKMITFGLNAAGDIRRLDAEDAGEISHLALSTIERNHVVTSVRSANNGTLRVLTWAVFDDGSIRRVGSVRGGNATGVAIAAAFVGAESFVVTPTRTAEDVWRNITWQANLQ